MNFDQMSDINLTNRQWFGVVCTLIDDDFRHRSGQNVVASGGSVSSQLTTEMTNIVVQTALNLCRFVFSPQYRSQIKLFFQGVTTAWHVDANSVVCSLINNGKLADQIATLQPIVVKKKKKELSNSLFSQYLRNGHYQEKMNFFLLPLFIAGDEGMRGWGDLFVSRYTFPDPPSGALY